MSVAENAVCTAPDPTKSTIEGCGFDLAHRHGSVAPVGTHYVSDGHDRRHSLPDIGHLRLRWRSARSDRGGRPVRTPAVSAATLSAANKSYREPAISTTFDGSSIPSEPKAARTVSAM
jgi:hypothetical protein